MRLDLLTVLLTTTLSLGSGTAAAFVDMTPASAESGSVGTATHLRATLSAPSTASLGEPISITVTIANSGPDWVQYSSYAPVYWLVDLSIVDPEGRPLPRSEQRTLFSRINLIALQINPGRSTTLSAPLASWGYVLDRPGRYRIFPILTTRAFVNVAGEIVADPAPPIFVTIE